MPTHQLTAKTNANVHFQEAEIVNPPLWWDVNFDLKAQLLDPAETCVEGTLAVIAVNGSIDTYTRRLRICHGQTATLGLWVLDGSDSEVEARERTVPPRPNMIVTVELEADPAAP